MLYFTYMTFVTHKVLVVGSKGVVGKVLSDRLPHDTTDFDLPEHNAQDYNHLYQKANGHDTVRPSSLGF